MPRLNIQEFFLPPKWSHFEKRFQEDLIENYSFNEHITETAMKLNMDRQIVWDVMTFYLKFVCTILMYVSMHRHTNIHIYGWFKITVFKYESKYGNKKYSNNT